MKNVIAIDLPQPSTKIIEAIKKFVALQTISIDSKNKLEEFHHHTINPVSFNFFVPDFLTLLVRKEYQHFFPHHQLKGMIGVFKNHTTSPACMPTHIDRTRAIGLNYFIDSGGNDVRTFFYDREDISATGISTNVLYSEVTPIENFIAKPNTWYCYNVRRCHSVENIETTRTFIALKIIRPGLGLDSDYEYNIIDFQKDYPHLCIGS
jgi:hypothetical protein